MTPLEVRPLEGTGAEILGADITALSRGDWNQIEAAFAAFGVIFFRDQIMTEREHIEFANRGSIKINRCFDQHPQHREIALVVKDVADTENNGSTWHADHSYDEEPALGSILVARELPPVGGDTLFCSMYAAFDALSSATQRELEGLHAVHSAHHVFGTSRNDVHTSRPADSAPDDARANVTHPVVIRHPISGRKALFVNPTFTIGIDGMSEIDGLALLNQLFEHCQRDEFIARFDWEPGSVALWDNRAVWHFAKNDYPGERRVMHRITIDARRMEQLVARSLDDMLPAHSPRRFDGVDRSRFPTHWQSAEGLGRDHFALRGASHTVEGFRIARETHAQVAVTLVGTYETSVGGGPLHGCIGTFEDVSGAIEVFVPQVTAMTGAVGDDGAVEIDVVAVASNGSGLSSLSAKQDLQRVVAAGLTDAGNDMIMRLFDQMKYLDTSVVVTAMRPIR